MNTEDNMTSEYDYIVIGAGSAGCVLANRLTSDPGTTVLLLEAGGPDSNPAIHHPPAWPTLFGSDVDWAYQTEPEPFLDQSRVPSPRGKVLGGTSAINALVYIRGDRSDYEGWQALGNPGWGYGDVLPYFKRSEDQQRGASDLHGVGGPLHVSDPSDPSLGSLTFISAAEALGHPLNSDFNGPQQLGTGLYQRTVKNGRRQSAAVAFLHPVLGRPNLTVQTGALVSRLLVEQNRAVGVTYAVQGTEQRSHARREVILAAGAINSPKLLLLSGIGPAAQLREMGIAVVADLPGVGENLQDHPLVKVVFQSKAPLPLSATSNLAEAGLFLHTGVEADEPAADVQFHFAPVPWPHPRFVCDGPGYSIGVNVARPRSRGRVHLRSANPADSPVIRANYLENALDLRKLARGVEIACEIGAHAIFDGIRGSARVPAPEIQGTTATEEFVRQACETIWHPVGTCKMGQDKMAVVGPDLRVHGIGGLRVADASVMPTITTGNTNAPTIMIGEKASAMISAG